MAKHSQGRNASILSQNIQSVKINAIADLVPIAPQYAPRGALAADKLTDDDLLALLLAAYSSSGQSMDRMMAVRERLSFVVTAYEKPKGEGNV